MPLAPPPRVHFLIFRVYRFRKIVAGRVGFIRLYKENYNVWNYWRCSAA